MTIDQFIFSRRFYITFVMSLSIVFLWLGMAIAEERKEDPHTWTRTDTALQVVYTTLHVMDWSQTLRIARSPERYGERNPLLPLHPSGGRVNAYLGGTLVTQTIIAYMLPKPARTAWQITWIAVEQDAVRHNRRHGLGISFHF